MKKIVTLLLVLTLCIGLCACRASNPDKPTSPSNPTEPSNELQQLSGTIIEVHEQYVIVEMSTKLEDGTYTQESIKVMTQNTKEYCKYDFVTVQYEERTEPSQEGELPSVQAITIDVDNMVCYKPIIYFYPEAETECVVELSLNGRLTCTYPSYDTKWEFVEKPDGTLVFTDAKEYYALYWEGTCNAQWDMSKGFCVKGKDTAAFLEWALKEQGLTAREANEFIIYWLPLMQENEYNIISFQTDVYTQAAALKVSPAPDSMLRVFMTYYASDEYVEIPAQEFEQFERQGFTVVEWGGSYIK